ncbi:MAG TPA: hypothetical protein VHC49_24005, partial [Mycobacteriales bacterium]|nr:hypothetical protein [Mycobacteriales bacterium]
TGRQVQNLIRVAIADMQRNPDEFHLEPSPAPPADLVDPFPEPESRRRLTDVLWWAWAQIPPGEGTAAAALLHYESEHGLRASGPVPPSRTERARWRRLAWSVLSVASYRSNRPIPNHSAIDRDFGPRYLAAVTFPEAVDRDALAALMSLGAGSREPGALRAALGLIRAGVRDGRDEAPELLGIFRDAVFRRGFPGIPPEVESKVLALQGIVQSEHHDLAGIASGRAALGRLDQLISRPDVQRSAAIRDGIVSDSLRLDQEIAWLYDSLGFPHEAHRQLLAVELRLRRLGDPEHTVEPYGWRQQLLLTRAVIGRHLGMRAAAATAADRATALVDDSGALPASWGIAAETVRVAVLLDDPAPAWADVHRRLAGLARRSPPAKSAARADRSALLGAGLVAWRAALMRRDPGGVRRAQAQVLALAGPWTGPESRAISRYQRLSSRQAAVDHQRRTGDV